MARKKSGSKKKSGSADASAAAGAGASSDAAQSASSFALSVIAPATFWNAVSENECPADVDADVEAHPASAPGTIAAGAVPELLQWFAKGVAANGAGAAKLEFAASLSKEERAAVHTAIAAAGLSSTLESCSEGVGEERKLTVYKKGSAPAKPSLTPELLEDAGMLYKWARSAGILKYSRDEIAEQLAKGDAGLASELKAVWTAGKADLIQTEKMAKLVEADDAAGIAGLLKEKPDLVKKADGRTGQPPLHTAARLGCVAALRALAAGGAGLEDKDEHGRTPLALARTFEQCDAEATLLQLGARDPESGRFPLNKAAAELAKAPVPAAAASAGAAPATEKPAAEKATVLDHVASTAGSAAAQVVTLGTEKSKPAAPVEAPKVEAQKAAPVEAPKPAAVEAPKPTAVEAPKPAAVEAPKPAAVEAPKPAAVEAPKPTAVEALKPAAVEAPKPAAVEALKPAAVEAPKPAAVEAPKPAAVEAPKPAPVEAPKPAAVEAPKPVAVEAPKSAAVEAPKPAAAESSKLADPKLEAPKPAAEVAKPPAAEAPKPPAAVTPKPAVVEAPKPVATSSVAKDLLDTAAVAPAIKATAPSAATAAAAVAVDPDAPSAPATPAVAATAPASSAVVAPPSSRSSAPVAAAAAAGMPADAAPVAATDASDASIVTQVKGFLADGKKWATGHPGFTIYAGVTAVAAGITMLAVAIARRR